MLGNSDSYPVSRHGRPPYPVIAGLDPGRDPAIRSGTSLRQMAGWVAGSDEWVAIDEKWYYGLVAAAFGHPPATNADAEISTRRPHYATPTLPAARSAASAGWLAASMP